MRRKYNKDHPLYPVYDLQRQILKRGGEINRDADLLAYYEGRSLVPDYKPMKILKSLIHSNCPTQINTKGLYDVNLIYYKKSRFSGWELHQNYSNYNKESSVLKTYLEDEDFKEMWSRLEDNELILRQRNNDSIAKLADKYTNILRLIKNNYKPIRMKPPTRNSNNLLSAIILAAGLIIASFIYAYSQRYEYHSATRFDKWTNTGESATPKGK